ncbi:sensor histidine kinase [Paenibacillus ferrarius]|uniref:sensor histidine kinase n=1 Tax=Paenibacillus ferrarius TaxID=1469647 RepID=UPI003D27E28A
MWRFSKNWLDYLRSSIAWKLILLNVLVMGIMIWLTGFSVKEFACYLVDQYRNSGMVNKGLFNDTMRDYLIRASLVAIAVAAVTHYIFIKRIVSRLRELTVYARRLTKGEYPETIQDPSLDEIGMLTHDFNQLVSALKQAEAGRKKMITDISHELRTPLSTIKGYLEALSEGVITGNRDVYRSLYDESLHLAELVEQVHQLSVWETKVLSKGELQPVEISEFIQSSIGAFDMQLKDKQIQSRIVLQPGTVMADPVGLKQIINNLMKNAIQYDEGGFIQILGEVKDEAYQVTVRNKGQRISPEQAEQVFERFYRQEPSRNRETGGSGLGLAIVKEIVVQHGGKAGLTTDGNDHSFWFTLPLGLENSNHLRME